MWTKISLLQRCYKKIWGWFFGVPCIFQHWMCDCLELPAVLNSNYHWSPTMMKQASKALIFFTLLCIGECTNHYFKFVMPALMNCLCLPQLIYLKGHSLISIWTCLKYHLEIVLDRWWYLYRNSQSLAKLWLAIKLHMSDGIFHGKKPFIGMMEVLLVARDIPPCVRRPTSMECEVLTFSHVLKPFTWRHNSLFICSHEIFEN